METEIIKTDNPNILIERTVIDREINIGELQAEKLNIIALLPEIENRLLGLKALVLPAAYQDIIISEILEVERILLFQTDRLAEINNLINLM